MPLLKYFLAVPLAVPLAVLLDANILSSYSGVSNRRGGGNRRGGVHSG